MGSYKTSQEIRIVDAEDCHKAIDKFENHFKDMCAPYDVSYYVNNVDCNEVIV